jgi:MscS family membrane protein
MAYLAVVGRLVLASILGLAAHTAPVGAELAFTGTDLSLIAPPDLSSPRATLTTLRDSLEQVYDVLDDAYAEHREDPGLFTSPAVAAKVNKADLLLRRAIAALDLSQVPAVSREQTGTETVLLLKEILDRLPAVPPESVPDAAAVKAGDIDSWTLPYSDIRIDRLTSGPRAGQFVFTAGTVAGARELYDTVRVYAERPDSRSDLYRFYTLTPGDLLPPKWYLWIEELPFWAQDAIFLGESLWQLVGVVLTFLVLFGAWWLIARLYRRRQADPANPPRRLASRLPLPILLIGVCFLAGWIIVDQLNISGTLLLLISIGLQVIACLAAAWAAYLICVGVAEWIVASPRVEAGSIDASLIRLAARVLGIAAAVATLFFGATSIGLPVYGVIAGLGVGGLALGLAARPTLENLIGGLILYADRPVKVGEFCKFGDKMGTVEEIGLRSTRIRAIDRTLITVPNAEFSNMELINLSRRDQTLFDTNLLLRYETTPSQLDKILQGIRELLLARPDVVHESVRVRFTEMGAYALAIHIRAYISRADTSSFLEIQEAILFGIRKIVADEGASIAIPASTTYQVREEPSGTADATKSPLGQPATAG